MSSEFLGLSPNKLYCQQVLGIREVLIPKDYQPEVPAPVSSTWSWEGDQKANFFMYVPEPMSTQLGELWEKIRQALKSPAVLFLRGEGSESDLAEFLQQFPAKKGLVFGRQWAEQMGLGTFKLGHVTEYGGVSWKMTYGLADMLGTGREVGKKKKEAWSHMHEILS